MADGVNHAGRDHAQWSASASDRRWGCPGSLALEAQGTLPDKEGHAAAWGTACHEVSEICLRDGSDAITCLDQEIKTKEHTITVDEEMCETAQEYIDYVRMRMSHGDSDTQLFLEQKFSLDALDTPFDAGGTGDTVLLFPSDHLIEVVDLKGGRGVVVEAKGNKQLRTYGLGALMANPGPWKRVRVTIVQPRAPHPDGRIRSEEFSVGELVEWTSDLLDAMRLSAQAMADMGKAGDWAGTHLSAGDHCTFCKANPVCPALEAKALSEAQAFFNTPGSNDVTGPPDPATLPIERLVRILDHADMITKWLNSVRAYVQDQAEMGVEITDGNSTYVLADKRAMRKWAVDDPLLDLCMETGMDVSDFQQEPKTMSPAQVEKVVGKKLYQEAVAGLVKKESSGLNLVRSDKTSRPAVLPPALQFFDNEEEK